MMRRGFLQMLGLGGAATVMGAPDVQQYSTQGLSLGMKSAATPIGFTMSLPEQIANARREYAGFLETDKAVFIARCIREWRDDGGGPSYEPIDPDIDDMKSWSKTTKRRVHMERKAAQRWRSNERYFVERISSLLGLQEKDK